VEEIIESGKADVVTMGRALLADPELPRKVIQNRTDEILRCMRCFTCLAERMQTQTRICALNPLIGREYESMFQRPATAKKRVLVAGGGVGGMEAAITAAQRGHQVLLCEKSGELGGAILGDKYIPFKHDAYAAARTLARRMALAGVEVRLNTEVTPQFVRDWEPDCLIVAVGGSPIVPFTGPNVFLASDLKGKLPGKRIAVLGGGLVGCETAVYCAMQGAEVTVVEMAAEVARDANARQRPALLKELERTTVRCGLRGLRAVPEGLVCADADGREELIEADAIVLAVGQKPNRAAADALRNTAPEVRLLGDCLKASTLREAIFQGYHAGLDV
jgi:NADPH-dependent 2,4-dienoyl-CoA reductase/sulfur reductase-like enzyme